jgi:hypothetical protein
VTFAAVAGHRCGRATPSLRDAPQPQSMERIGRDSIYRDRNAVQTKPATFTVILVPRCLGWVETSSLGQSQIELSGQQVDDGL